VVGDLSGQRVVVVGGGSRLGRAIALAAAGHGADIVVAGRSSEALKAVVGQAGGRSAAFAVDLSEPETINRLANDLGAFDHLISTVSMHAAGPLAELTDEVVQRALDAKVLGPLRIVRAMAGQVRSGGSFTFFSGQAAWRPGPGAVATATVNGALAFLVRALAVEIAPVRVNAVAPGVVDSGVLDHLGDAKAETLDQAAGRTLVGRVGTGDDITALTLMLISNGYITGTVVHADGGGPLT
jgi:NAD(P)-dependent dehydrogenase (short-subunit alcohol dehydrogenase family)